ncbi:uncharacterized protein LOC123511460 isoform X4 [Portunus trituberculatus]|uniref:uncharacterized protein LOC123511460 isoform X4 n=1 Tax=Portunus trituberculatus TaxID=210409 RepID=UPI001E1CE9DC|nr:uncharacterized protein LOC123511460 isoform X4 [Portunus trituberculatus]
MVNTVCVAFLCLSVGVRVAAASSAHAEINRTDFPKWVMQSVSEASPANEREGQTRSMSATSPPVQLAASGMAQLVHRMAVFSHALNLTPTQSEAGTNGGDNEHQVSEALAQLLHRMTLFSHALNLSTTQSMTDNEQKVSEGLADLVHRVALFSHALNPSSTQGKSGGIGDSDQRMGEGLVDLVRTMTLFSHSLNLSSAHHENGGNGDNEQRVSEGLAELVDRMTLFSHALTLSNGDTQDDNEQMISEGLAELVQRMALLSKALVGDHLQYSPSTTTFPPSPPASTTSTPERERPCLPPFEQIAYRMCILQEMQLKLSWSDAQEFCRERGAELAQDMTVIKTRRFLNDLYGEDGTRSRWPVWVGGRRAEQQTWRWSGFADLEVPSFLWAPDEPRTYSRDLMPEGVCMILDGYRRFHGASLPCHLRRRFLCELRN